MSERPTPETDAFSVEFKTVCGSKKWVPVDLSRRLERERDEAREKYHQICSQTLIEINKAHEERDEARAKYATEATEHMLAVNKLCNERDEARELAEAYKEYAQVLGVEINDMVIHAHVHGLKFSRFEQSKVLHEKIKQLEASK